MENLMHLCILCYIGTLATIFYFAHNYLKVQKERNCIEKERNDFYRKITRFDGCDTILRLYQSEILSEFVAKHPSVKQILDDEKFNFIIEEFNLEDALTGIEPDEPVIPNEPVNLPAEDDILP